MKMKIKNLLFNLAVPLIFALIISLVIQNDFTYLDSLNRKINIPNIVFPIVWTVLYPLMGLWAYYYEVDEKKNKLPLIIYWSSLILNLLFTPLLFIGHQVLISTLDIVVLLVMILYLFICSLNKKKKYAYFLLPYVLWLIIAFSLMIDILIHN